MKKFIATTTINPPTEAYIKFINNFPEWTIVISGDEKTPNTLYENLQNIYHNVIFLSLDKQNKLFPNFSKLLGFNTIERRNFSVIYSYLEGADIIALVDDDNIPLKNWGEILLNKKITVPIYTGKNNIFDPLSACCNEGDILKPWHRGFPIQSLYERESTLIKKEEIFYVQQDMWLGDPDVDAYYRFIRNKVELDYNINKFPFATDSFSPFNSQNTFIDRTIVPNFILFPELKRMADIWIAYYLCSLGYKILYNTPSVIQSRNVHNYTKDFSDEVIGYLQTYKLIEKLKKSSDNFFTFLSMQSLDLYNEFKKIIQ